MSDPRDARTVAAELLERAEEVVALAKTQFGTSDPVVVRAMVSDLRNLRDRFRAKCDAADIALVCRALLEGAQEPLDSRRFLARSEAWEADEVVVTVNGKPCGGTLSKGNGAVVARWFNEARRDLFELIAATRPTTEDTRR